MKNITNSYNPKASASNKRRALITDGICVALVLVLGTAIAAGAADKRKGENDKKEQRKAVPQSQEIESKGGLRLKGVELVADGGLVLMRYTVLDPSKVEKVKQKEGKKGGPVVEGKGNQKDLVPSGGMKHGRKLRAGQSDFTLFQNTDGAVRKGDVVNITIEGTTISNVAVE